MKPLYVHYYDSDNAIVYNLTKSQYDKLREQWDEDKDDPADLFIVSTDAFQRGYIPEEVALLSQLLGFEVGSE